ncbi:RNA 2',3'-cyclic phosphodiesterase [Acidaminobacter sp.]|uniref:RNA 2',3'-cyclic phosphodiesterase n=1 Tax=Acidaminobacter sp. TaxID=1872102 RepID=UPI00137F0F86|nr:RNA 2',3'-cyclic phosphodiesterase [Acidaminobacter sp.]MDK9711639.1 RNA 2',3'-cyclic phosphodiesterase [Acidaminobacter sp.]MZQ98258.1 RNA 2',3'-cyclic phosphodiesterase [Acidaminobacter sp.]
MREQEGKIIKGKAVGSPAADSETDGAGGIRQGKEKPGKIRLFIGLELPPAAKARIHKAAGPVLSRIQKGKLTEADNYHLTVFFIGEVTEEAVAAWKACVAEAAAVSEAFDLILCHTGFFSRKNRKILWFGSEASERLETLYKHVMSAADDTLSSQGKPGASTQPGANRPFRPHVTLGREIVAEDDAAVIQTERIKVRVETLTLFESKRISGRLAYVPIARGRLRERL